MPSHTVGEVFCLAFFVVFLSCRASEQQAKGIDKITLAGGNQLQASNAHANYIQHGKHSNSLKKLESRAKTTMLAQRFQRKIKKIVTNLFFFHCIYQN